MKYNFLFKDGRIVDAANDKDFIGDVAVKGDKIAEVSLNEPPYTERYVRWCEGTVDKLIIYLLLDLKFLNKEGFLNNL